MAKLITEFVGTFFLVLTVGLAGGAPLGALAIGAALMVRVYMGGAVSGAQYHPAVTVAVWMRGKCSVADLVPYIVVQILAAVAAAGVVYAIVGKTFVVAPGEGVKPLNALLIEFLFTFALALVVLNVATTKAGAGNSYFGLAIGLTVFAAAVSGGAISGGAFNPAVGLGPNLVHMAVEKGSLAHVWLYIVGPFAGGALAAIVFRLQHGTTAD